MLISNTFDIVDVTAAEWVGICRINGEMLTDLTDHGPTHQTFLINFTLINNSCSIPTGSLNTFVKENFANPVNA